MMKMIMMEQSRLFKIFTSLILVSVSAASWAQENLPAGFQKVAIPGAKCGDGSPYALYLKEGDTAKLLIHLEGGGACWNKRTCYGPVGALTTLHLDPSLVKGAYFGPHLDQNPFADYSYAYFPYCTGDFFVGTHETEYSGRRVAHVGRQNVVAALAWLEQNFKAAPSRVDSIVAYGDSAGALGVMMDLDLIDAATPLAVNRVALMDSPGLHFNDNVWRRFSEAYLANIAFALKANHMNFDPNKGVLAPELRNYCAGYPAWKVGVSQGAMDIVMSLIFGNLTPIEHYFRVMGKSGVYQQLLDPNDNCSAWVPKTSKHVFGLDEKGWGMTTKDGTSNGAFTREVVSSALLAPHPSHK